MRKMTEFFFKTTDVKTLVVQLCLLDGDCYNTRKVLQLQNVVCESGYRCESMLHGETYRGVCYGQSSAQHLRHTSFLYQYCMWLCSMICPPDAVRWQCICYGDVAVCVSATLMYCAKTTESIIMQLSPDCGPAILVSPVPNTNLIIRGDPLTEGVKWEKGS